MILIKKNKKFSILFITFFVLINSCSLNTKPNNLTYNQSLYLNQKAYIDKEIKNNSKKIFFIGLALWGNESKWSENDIIDLSKIFTKAYPEKKLIPIIISNRFQYNNKIFHYFQINEFNKLILYIRNNIKEDDLVIITISTHGNKNSISNKLGFAPVTQITGNELRTIFYPLEFNQKIYLISSCFSGSLIKSLKSDKTIIITAASSNRASFGCEESSENTWFVKALKKSANKFFDTDTRFSLNKWFRLAKHMLFKQEKNLNYKHSNPQIFIGNKINYFFFKV